MSQTSEEMLRQAVAQNAPVVLTLPSAGMFRDQNTRFLAQDPGGIDNSADGIWIESPAGDMILLDKLIAECTPVGIAFHCGATSVVFSEPIHRRLDAFSFNQAGRQIILPALLLPFPQNFKPLQRRSVFRAAVGLDTKIQLRIWRIPDNAVLQDIPVPSSEFPARARDLSVTGMAFVCRPKDGKLPQLTIGQRLRVQLKFAGHDLLVDARLMHQRLLDGNILVGGMDFKKLEENFDGRRTLSKLTAMVAALQREALMRRGGQGVNETLAADRIPPKIAG